MCGAVLVPIVHFYGPKELGYILEHSGSSVALVDPEIAGQLGERKVETLERLGADVIATGNIGCATQIGMRTKLPVVHTVELLDWAYGGPKPAGLP